MRIVVTGATSFVGASTVREFLLQGHDVTAIVRPSSRTLDKLMLEEPKALERRGNAVPAGQLTIVENDLAKAQELVGKISEPCDVFCHFGWGGSGSGARNDGQLQEGNLRAALAAMQAARELGCGRFLFSGSQAEYGLHHTATTEETDCSPRSAYGRAKLAVLQEGSRLCEHLGMEYIHLRIFSAYGPGDHPWTLVESCLTHFLEGAELLLGACTQEWNFVYIDDLAKAVCCLALLPSKVLKGIPNPVFNLAGDETKPLREFVEEIYTACRGTGPYQFGRRAENAEGAVNLIPDIHKIKRVTGWRPETEFKAGIQECIRRREKPSYTHR